MPTASVSEPRGTASARWTLILSALCVAGLQSFVLERSPKLWPSVGAFELAEPNWLSVAIHLLPLGDLAHREQFVATVLVAAIAVALASCLLPILAGRGASAAVFVAVASWVGSASRFHVYPKQTSIVTDLTVTLLLLVLARSLVPRLCSTRKPRVSDFVLGLCAACLICPLDLRLGCAAALCRTLLYWTGHARPDIATTALPRRPMAISWFVLACALTLTGLALLDTSLWSSILHPWVIIDIFRAQVQAMIGFLGLDLAVMGLASLVLAHLLPSSAARWARVGIIAAPWICASPDGPWFPLPATLALTCAGLGAWIHWILRLLPRQAHGTATLALVYTGLIIWRIAVITPGIAQEPMPLMVAAAPPSPDPLPKSPFTDQALPDDPAASKLPMDPSSLPHDGPAAPPLPQYLLADSDSSDPQEQAAALSVPGDVFIIHDRATLEHWRSLRDREGWRPDISLIDGHRQSAAKLHQRAQGWAAGGRRILSDSFSLGDRWPCRWAVETPPLYWFLFSDLESSTNDDRRPPPPAAASIPSRKFRAQMERARYRRCATDPRKSFEPLALPDDRHAGLDDALQVAHAMRIPNDGRLELHWSDSSPPTSKSTQSACALAQAGDILSSMGSLRRGSALLLEAGNSGCEPALGALVRWQFSSGQQAEAWQSLDYLSGLDAGPRELALTWKWLLDRGRTGDALRLRQRVDELGLNPPPSTAGVATWLELENRLRLVRQLSQPQEARRP